MKNVWKSLGVKSAIFPLTALATFVATYLQIDYAGPDSYGTIATLATISLLLPFADLGLGARIVNDFSVVSAGDAVPASLGMARRLLSAVAVLLIAISWCSAVALPWGETSIFGNLDADTASRTAAVGLSFFAIALPLGLSQRVLVGLGLNHRNILLSALGSVGFLCATFLCVLIELPAEWMIAATPLGTLIGMFALHVHCKAVLRRRNITSCVIGSLTYRELFVTAGPMLIVMISLPIAFQSQRLIVAVLSSPQVLSEFSLLFQIYTPLWSFISVAAMALWPQFAARRSGGANPGPLVLRSSIGFAAIGGAGFLAMVVLAPSLSDLISSGSIAISGGAALFAGALVLVQSAQQIPGMFLTDAAGLRVQAVLCVALAAAAPLGTALLLPTLGSVAPFASLALCVLAVQLLPGGALVALRVVRHNRLSG